MNWQMHESWCSLKGVGKYGFCQVLWGSGSGQQQWEVMHGMVHRGCAWRHPEKRAQTCGQRRFLCQDMRKWSLCAQGMGIITVLLGDEPSKSHPTLFGLSRYQATLLLYIVCYYCSHLLHYFCSLSTSKDSRPSWTIPGVHLVLPWVLPKSSRYFRFLAPPWLPYVY